MAEEARSCSKIRASALNLAGNRWNRLSKLLELPQASPEVKVVQQVPTKRAQLGRSIKEKWEDDADADINEVVVELFKLQIQSVPLDQGWLLLGFPCSLGALSLFEQDESTILQAIICSRDNDVDSSASESDSDCDNKYDMIVPKLQTDSCEQLDYMANIVAIRQIHQARIQEVRISSKSEDLDHIIDEVFSKKAHADEDTANSKTPNKLKNMLLVKSIADSQAVYNDLQQEVAMCEMIHRDRLTKTLQSLSELRNQVIQKADSIVPSFIDFISRPDAKQALITDWISSYNKIDRETRTEIIQDEQHAKLSNLVDDLYDVVDQRKEEAEIQRENVITIDGLDQELNEILFYYLTLAKQEIVSTIIQTACLRRHYAYQVELSEEGPAVLTNEYRPDNYFLTLKSRLLTHQHVSYLRVSLKPIIQPDIKPKILTSQGQISIDTVDIQGKVLLVFESFLAEVTNLFEFEQNLCFKIGGIKKHKAIQERARDCQIEARIGIKGLTDKCRFKLNDIHNHFKLEVKEIKTKIEQSFSSLDLLIERYFCDEAATIASFERKARVCIQSNAHVELHLVHHKAFTGSSKASHDKKLEFWLSYYSGRGKTRLDVDEIQHIATELSSSDEIMEYAKGDWRVLLFAATKISDVTIAQLKQRANIDEFGMTSKKLDKSTWMSVMTNDRMAAKIGWSLNNNGQLPLSDVLQIINKR